MDEHESDLTPEEARRRASIRYILRRRGRANKQRANSGATVKSWAEYSEVNFKPDGDSSGWKYASATVLLSVVVIVVSLPFAIVHMQPPTEIQGYPIWLAILVWLIIAMVAVGALVVILATLLAIKRALFDR